MRKSVIIIYLMLSCCALLPAMTFAQPQTSNKEPNQPDYLRPIPPDKLKEDLDFLCKTIEEVHPNMYAYTSKEEFEPIREQLYKNLNRPMTRLEFYKLTAFVVASLNNTHTFLVPFIPEYKQYLASGGKVFPSELRLDNSKVIVAKNYSSTSLPLGSEVITINERSTSEMFETFSHWFAAEGRSTNPQLIEHATLLRVLLLLEFGPVESWQIEIKANDTEEGKYTVKSISAEELEGQGGPTAFEPKNSYQYFYEHNTALLKINSFGGDLEKFRKFLSNGFQEIHKQKARNLIIDVRENTGAATHMCTRLLNTSQENLTGYIKKPR